MSVRRGSAKDTYNQSECPLILIVFNRVKKIRNKMLALHLLQITEQQKVWKQGRNDSIQHFTIQPHNIYIFKNDM